MKPYQKTYLDIVLGNPSYDSFKLNQQIINLHSIRVPSATYPFIMKVIFEIQTTNLSLKKGIRLLEFLESFLVRRAILGFEPTGLHAIFKGVWNEIESQPSVENLKAEILNRSTIQYPSNKEVKNAIKTRSLYKARITPYLLREYDKSLEGDTPSEDFTIEHIMPNTWIEGDKWSQVIKKEKHTDLKDTLANLIPLSGELNKNVQRDVYSKKMIRFKKESMFITPRDLSDRWQEWTEETIEERAEILSNWAIKRWKE